MKNFIFKFNLQESLFREFFMFVVNQKNNEEIISYYTRVSYSKIPKREYTCNENYNYKIHHKIKKKKIKEVKGI